MGADILERLEAIARFYENQSAGSSRGPNCYAIRAELARDSAAEIGRLRGEVAKWQGLAEAGVTLAEIQRRREQRIAKRETTAPAMPNGVEADLSAQLDAMTAAYERMTAYTIVHNGQLVYMSDLGRAAYSDVVAERDAALRAADNRDAAGVAEQMRQAIAISDAAGSKDIAVSYLREWVATLDSKTTPAAVPAGEAVAVYEGNPCVECGEDTGTGHFPGCCLGTTPQPADGEASMFAGQSDAQIAHAVRMAEQHYRSLGRDPVYCNVSLSVLRDCTPPAPVQAAPQEGSDHG